MTMLPKIMVAPNGARHGKDAHSAVPITLSEVLDCAEACAHAGADGLHFHLRDEEGAHLLDAGAYREAITELHARVPAMTVQITTEAAGKYEPPLQMDVALGSGCELVSVSIREIAGRQDEQTSRRFYDQCADAGITVQHILYSTDDLALLRQTISLELLLSPNLQLLWVLGKYGDENSSSPELLDPILKEMRQFEEMPDWMVCAFGRAETDCLVAAHSHGAKLRVGFENSFWNRDGSLALDNAERVRELVQSLRENS
ncbi:3-keto-5-aminohexanoate cleavage protein [Halocynthiibacter sp. C4]|uniref:3-keto-5-aminohexanoate cleavage protein n=1 Tax=Halocynthiibacter sp. C4 TaxID=2992758 RepID=UPI00237B50A5|nr:3-keto-5-aminohexanoate cleavage protein [Halocynthiibacter sp. C4]MDE0588868.1 3-keto-5-aminohexanoate cleavage protein [Halocynthiibacter sp. C4]